MCSRTGGPWRHGKFTGEDANIHLGLPRCALLTNAVQEPQLTFSQWPFQKPIYWRYLPYIRPKIQAYVREYPHKILPKIWYSTSILGSWNSHWFRRHIVHGILSEHLYQHWLVVHTCIAIGMHIQDGLVLDTENFFLVLSTLYSFCEESRKTYHSHPWTTK